MAVLEGLEGIEVTVRVDNQALYEYNDDDAEKQPGVIGEYQASKTVTKYVEAITGKEFSISIEVKAPYKMDCPTLSFHAKVDGSLVDQPILRKRKYRKKSWQRVIMGVKHHLDCVAKRCSIQHFRFAEVQTTEDQSKLNSMKDDVKCIESCGEISIWVFRKSEAIRVPELVNYSLESSLGDSVHEKAMKGHPKSHGTSLGAAEPAQANRSFESDFLDGEDKPIGIYRFKYRSKNVEEEAAGSSSPTTAVDDRLTPQMKRKIEEYKKSLLEAENDSKLKSENIKHEAATRIKRENPEQRPSRKANKKPKYKMTIDLTEEDDETSQNAIPLDD